MSKNYVIKIQRTSDGFMGTANGNELDFEKLSKIVDAVKEDLESELTVRSDVIARRNFIAANDLFKGKPGYMGSSKLAKHFNVSVGTISVDRKVIEAKKIQPDPELVKELEEINASPEIVKDVPIKEETGKKNGKGKGKGKKGKK